MDFPTIEAPAAAPAPRTEVATAAAQALDLGKIDLAAVVRAQFGPWRETVAELRAANAKTVLDLPTQAKVNEAKSLRERTINVPVAEARKTCKALKSMLAAASATAGEEVDALVLAYTAAAEPITKQIDAAQARIDHEKAEKARIEREAQERHAARLATIAGYITHCQQAGMTAERIERGMAALASVDLADEDGARAEALAGARNRALEQMRTLHAQAVAREEEAARQERIRQENERVAAELAAERQRIADEAAAVRRAAEELAAREAAAREAEAAQKTRQAMAEQAEREAVIIAALQAEQVAESERQKKLAEERLAALPKFGGIDPKFCPGSNPDCPQEFPEQRFPNEPIRADDPDAAPHTTAAEMGGDRADPGEAVGLAEVNPEPEPAPADTLQILVAEARASAFPSHPKMPQAWWQRLYALADAGVTL